MGTNGYILCNVHNPIVAEAADGQIVTLDGIVRF